MTIRNVPNLFTHYASWAVAAVLIFPAYPANPQTVLPPVQVIQGGEKQKRSVQRKRLPHKQAAPKPLPGAGQSGGFPADDNASGLESANRTLDAARSNLQPKAGTNTYEFNREAIETLPEGSNASVGTILQQAPGVNQETAASFEGPVHIRLEHGFIQYRVDGILLPDGATGFTQVLDANFISNLTLVTGALPAQYGFRTAGVVDITSRSGSIEGGEIGTYGGSRGTVTPYFNYGGTAGDTQYFLTGRYFESNIGIENPTSAQNAIHDETGQGKFFAYTSTLLDPSTRLIFLTGSSVSQFQIPNNPAQVQPPGSLPVPGLPDFNSSQLNERQFEQNYYSVLAVQRQAGNLDWQLAYYTRYSSVHFVPDPEGDLFFNNVSTDVLRTSFLNGLSGDRAYKVDSAHTLRAGFLVSAEQTQNDNSSLVLATGPGGACGLAAECTIPDGVSKTGWLFGAYVQDEWKITERLTLTPAFRFDQMWEFVDANQVSPRASLVYKPFDDTILHAGYARYFTPASQVLSASPSLALYQGTTLQPAIAQADPVLPERSNYFDAGVDQKLLPGLQGGLAAYYKLARDQIDVGQFGQALVLDEFNYKSGFNRGVEVKLQYADGPFRAYGNLAWAQQFATDIVSQQYLFDPATLAYVSSHTIFTDLSQAWTGSAGVSYQWEANRLSTDMIYGSGLRAGFANTQSMAPYAQFNLGLTRDFEVPGEKPWSLRFTVVSLLDNVYELRNGTGIGVFAPQYGPRRGFFVGLSKKF